MSFLIVLFNPGWFVLSWTSYLLWNVKTVSIARDVEVCTCVLCSSLRMSDSQAGPHHSDVQILRVQENIQQGVLLRGRGDQEVQCLLWESSCCGETQRQVIVVWSSSIITCCLDEWSPTLEVSTCGATWPRRSGRTCSSLDTREWFLETRQLESRRTEWRLRFLTAGTGETRVWWLMSRTRELVDHAGYEEDIILQCFLTLLLQAFAATEQIESYTALASGQLTSLSTQQMTSCTPNPLTCGGTGGCMGSTPPLGYNYIQLFGQMKEEDYPYTSGSTSQVWCTSR